MWSHVGSGELYRLPPVGIVLECTLGNAVFFQHRKIDRSKFFSGFVNVTGVYGILSVQMMYI